MRLRYIIVSGIFLPMALGVGAVSPTPLGQIVDRIVSSNVSLAAGDAAESAALDEFDAENVLPGPELEFEHMWNSSKDGENRWSAGVSQSLPWPVALSRRGELKSAMSATARYRTEAARNEFRLKVTTMLLDFVAAKKDCDMLRDVAASLTEMYERYKRAYDSGEATIIDVNKARIEAARANMESRTAMAQLDVYMADIMGLTSDADVAAELSALDEYPPYELRDIDYYLESYGSSAEAFLAESLIREAELQGRYAKASLLPGLSLGYVHAYEDGSHFNGLSVGIGLPSWNFRSSAKSSTSRKLEASFSRDASRIQALQNIRAEYRKAESLRKELAEFAPAVEGVNNIAILKRALDGGELTLLAYLQESTYFVEAMREYIRLRHDYALAVCTLSRYITPAE